jgi:urease accessory protein
MAFRALPLEAIADAVRLDRVSEAPIRHQRAAGGVAARFGPGPAGARPRALRQAAPLRLLLPDPEPGEWTTAALLNTGGGLAGGDDVSVALTLEPGARLTLATAAAEKLYRALGPATRIANTLELGAGAALEWIPQESILFDGAALRRRTEVTLAADARLLALETLAFGRAARGEVLRDLRLHDAWRLRQGGRLLWADALRLEDAAPLTAPLGLDGAGAFSTLLCAGPGAEAQFAPLRAALEGVGLRAGVTRPAPGLVLLRALGGADALRRLFARLLPDLRAEFLGQPARLPRLWTN